VTHTPEPALLRSFARDGYELVLAGHTHGGQVRVPFGPAIVTNCGIDVRRARWLHQWDDQTWFHVSAGLGTGPYSPVRIACRPEATLLTLVAR
jgi:predicted MPP superfamily phosphohydrolase